MEIKKLIYNEEQILNLYLDNHWLAYTNEPSKLFEGINNSLDAYGAYIDGLLVGLIRTIGDSSTIIYIQDVLVLKSYQGRGIGSKLVRLILDKYQSVRQIVLSTDNKAALRGFYEPLGFKEYRDMNILGFYFNRDK